MAGGEALLAPSVTRRLISEFTRRAKPSGTEKGGRRAGPARSSSGNARWSPRRGQGLGNEETRPGPVHQPGHREDARVARAMIAKLGALDRAQLVVFAYETGLVRAGLA